VLFHARIAAERSAFGVDDVATTLVEKLVRRHPHVFGDAEGVEDAAAVQRNWDRLKAEEKGGGRGPLDGIPQGMPGLGLLDALLRRVRRLGMLPEDRATLVAGLRVTLAELDALGGLDGPEGSDGRDADAEPDTLVARLLVEAAGLARLLDVEADAAARAGAARLRAAVEAAVAADGSDGSDAATVWPRALHG
jgi:uncharacterized protein YabN with tetrapyrrole methylase and pyrophosphatase domain